MNEPRRRVRAWWWPAIVLLAGLATGCGASQPPQPLPDPDKIDLPIADRAAYDAAVGNLRGKVVLVDFWAHWCGPCVENFPHVIKLANRNWGKGLATVTVNVDAPEAAHKTLDFLKAQRAGVATHLVSRFGGGSQSMEVFEIPGGAVPCYKIYDRQGKLRQTFATDPTADRQFSVQDIDAAVEKLLAE